MAVSHNKFDDTLPHGQLKRRALTNLENGVEELGDLIACMTRMIDGDGSDPAHFTYVQQRFGYDSNEKAKAAWEELNSLYSKFSGNGAVTDVNAAMLQAFAEFR